MKTYILLVVVAVVGVTGVLLVTFTGNPVVATTQTNEPYTEEKPILIDQTPSKIIGGEQSPYDAFPWFGLGKGCGSALIAPEWLLTAAHCGNKHFQRVRIGAVCRRSADPHFTNCDTPYEMVRSQKQYVHPNYNRDTMLYDLRLVHLKKTTSVLPVDIDDGSISFNYTDGQGDLWAVGFGLESINPEVFSDHLMRLEKKYVPRKRCKQSYTKKNGHVFDKSILCAESGDDLKSACYGDSGGPLYDETNQKLVGIVSNGPRDCSGRPVRFARVGAAYDWILETICKESRDKPEMCFDPSLPSSIPSIAPSPAISNAPSYAPTLAKTSEFQIILQNTNNENETKWCLEATNLSSDPITVEICNNTITTQLWRTSRDRTLRTIANNNLCLTDTKDGLIRMSTCEEYQTFVYDSLNEAFLSIRNKGNFLKWGLKVISLDEEPDVQNATTRQVTIRKDEGYNLQKWLISHV